VMNADVVGLMEIENDATGNSALEDLVAGLNAAMGAGTYAFIDTGVIGTDEIKVALIYKPASVTPVGAWKIITTATDPRFLDTRNRPSLAQTFEHTASGERFTAVVNHLKSKSSACADIGDPDTGDGQGNCNLTRKKAAEALVDWLAGDPTGSGDSDFLLIGDMNAYKHEDPITAFTNGGLTNLVDKYLGESAYVFNGESGYLDHAIGSASFAAQVTGVTEWHLNPDEPTVLDYNTNFKTPNQWNTFYAPTAYRSSDHDPVLVGVQFNIAPTVVAGGPYTVAEGGSVSVSAAGTDANGDALTYAWDLDNDGSFETAGQTAAFSAALLDGPTSRTIRVQVTDTGGKTGVASTVVDVTNAAPTATFNAPATTLPVVPFTISLTSPQDPAPADTFTYAFDCGAGYGAFGAATSRSCSALALGSRSVGAKIRDDDGGEREYRATVLIAISFDAVCSVVRQYASTPQVADKLCALLDKAKHDATKDKRHSHLDQFDKEVEKNKRGALTTGEAAMLQALARLLDR
jgi:hypothetical protein